MVKNQSSSEGSDIKETSYKYKEPGIGTGIVKIFHQIKNKLDDSHTLNQSYRHLLDLSCEHLELDAGIIFLKDKNDKMRLFGHCCMKVDPNEDYAILETGIIAEAMDTGFPRFITDLNQIEGNCQELFEKFSVAWLLPVISQNIPVGMIIFPLKDIPEDNEYNYSKLDFVSIAASWFYENHCSQILIARENKRNEMLVQTSLEIFSSLDLNKVCDVLATRLGSYFGCSYSYVLLDQDGSSKMYLQKYYSKRGTLDFDGENRIIDIGRMSWLKDILSGEGPVFFEADYLSSNPEDDLIALKLLGASNVLIAPLKHAGKSIGILVMVEQRTAERASLKKEIVDLSAALVAQASAAIENARLYTTVSDKVAQLATMFEVGQALNSDLDLIPFYNRVLDAISKNFGITSCAFLLRDFNTNELYVVTIVGNYPQKLLGKRIKIGKEGNTGYAAAIKKPVNVGDTSRDERFIKTTGNTGSELAVPVLLNNKVVGVLDVESEENYAFSQREEDLLMALMDQVAAAMEKIKLKQQEHERATKIALTNYLVKKLSGIINKSELLVKAVKVISEGFGFDLVAVFVPEKDGGFKLAQQSCRSGQGYESDIELLQENGALAKVSRTKKSYFLNNIQSDEPDSGLKGIKSRYCIPLIAGRKLHGILDIQDKRPNAFTKIDMSTLQTIAEFLAVTLTNVNLYSDSIDTAERLSLVDQINQAISATLDLDELFSQVVKSLLEITGYNWATLVFKEQEGYCTRLDYLEVHKREKQDLPEIESMEKYFTEVIVRSKPAYFDINKMELAEPLKKYFKDKYINYIAISPIKHENRPIGFLLVGNPNPEGFRSQDYSLLYDVSQHLEIAITNAILYSDIKKAYDRLSETQEKLIQNEKFKALGEVSAGIVHDFKNILASIVGRVQMLTTIKDQDKEITERMLFKSLEIIEKSANDGVNILSRINEFTKINRKTKLSTINLKDVINDTIEMIRPRWEDQSEGKKIKVKTIIKGDLPIAGNRSELVEVISNLIINALDAIPDDGKIKVDTFEEDDKVVLQVSDNGTGMDAETIKRIFDPYFTTKGRKGTGLGLSMVYAIVNRHNGEVDVESMPGKGTSFTLKFPVLQKPCDQTRFSILVVEDDENLRSVLHDIFKELGQDVSLASSYAEARDNLTNQTFDLVLTDLGLPDKDGWKIVDIIKNTYSGTYVVPMTGWNKEINNSDLKTRGLSQVLRKPFNIEQVENLLQQITSRRKVDAGRIA